MSHSQSKSLSFISGIGVFILSLMLHTVFGLFAALASRNASEIYQKIKLPDLALDAVWYGRVWMVLYVFLALAVCLVWSKRDEFLVEKVIVPYAIHLVLQASWSWIFFDIGRADFALMQILFLWIVSFWLMCAFMRIHFMAGLLMLAYQAWLSFATYLNGAILLLNGANVLVTSAQ
jgi:tryptophan-rich sensory protein